jgi:hypothetical protein
MLGSKLGEGVSRKPIMFQAVNHKRMEIKEITGSFLIRIPSS